MECRNSRCPACTAQHEAHREAVRAAVKKVKQRDAELLKRLAR